MLVLSRKIGERIVINDSITVVVQRLSGNRVALGIEAPPEVSVLRGELNKKERESQVTDHDRPVLARIGCDATPLPVTTTADSSWLRRVAK